MEAVGYARISAEEAANGHEDLSTQEDRIRKYSKSQGLDLVRIYLDEPVGILRSNPGHGDFCSRVGITNLLDHSNLEEWPFVVVTNPDRLKATDLDFDPFECLVNQGRAVVTVGEDLGIKEDDKRHAKGKLRRLGTAESVAERLLRGREAGARAGNHQSGPAPYGYCRDYSQRYTKGVLLQIHHEEAAIVRLIFKEYLRRKSMKRLIEFLDSQSLKTRRKKQWSRAGVSWILKNETYLGKVHFGKIRAKGQHPRIIASIIFNKVQVLLKKNNKRGGKQKEVVA